MLKIGLIINPIAGMGGRVGLKGTDGEPTYTEALRRGGEPVSYYCMGQCIRSFRSHFESGGMITFFICNSSMGSEKVESMLASIENIRLSHCYDSGGLPTTAADTLNAVLKMTEEGAELLCFAGGDGTARDLLSGIENSGVDPKPLLLGVPAGVKMHSSVFALSPEAAGEILAAYVAGKTDLEDREIMDIDEDNYRRGILTAKLHGYASVPVLKGMVQHSKSAGIVDEEMEKEGIAEEIAHDIEADNENIYFLGAGTTVFAVKKRLGINGSLLGVDAVMGREMIGKDVWDEQMLDMLDGSTGKIILTPIGRQGFLLGRGNQQFSAEVLETVGIHNIRVISTRGKLDEIENMIIYTGDRALDDQFPKFMKVLVGPDRFKMVCVIKA
ncbi:MAG: ATP-NAD kinase family protein [Candidatus Thermoplasmatota archaeon]|jgi:predicted polyphosphate/ATP-dependent NAD kinase|nr:ATP-NAD kinase family protein [Candidatus Thermoplasmatota archaeon]MDP7264067.1 ATP-NAD kinase family protein [Candidatus Thermoplasmatota archaeon]